MAWTKEVTCSTGEVVKSYDAYLKTKHWAELSDRIKELAGGKCSKCGANPHNKELLHSHHLTYFNIGNEPNSDLICVCRACHMELHEIKKFKDGKRISNKAIIRGYLTLKRLKRETPNIIEIFKNEPDPKKALIEAYSKKFAEKIMRSPMFKEHNKQWKPRKRKPVYTTTRNGKNV